MKVIIEKDEILFILGKHFGTKLKSEDVTIRTDPALEIELRNLTIHEGDAAAPEAAAKPAASPAAIVSEEIEDVLRESEQLRRADRNVLSAVPDNSADEV